MAWPSARRAPSSNQLKTIVDFGYKRVLVRFVIFFINLFKYVFKARIMKRVKTANFTDLIGMIQREAAQRFQPSVPLIKKVIDILLEKNFIERKEDMRDTYVYVAWENERNEFFKKCGT